MKGIFYSKEGNSPFIHSFWIALLYFSLWSHHGISLDNHLQEDDTTKASQLSLKAIELARAKNYDSAISNFKEAANLYMQADVWDRFFYAHQQVGYLLNTQYKYPQTHKYLDSIATHYSKYLNPQLNSYQQFYGVLAWSQFSLLNYEEALHYFEIIDEGAWQNPSVKPKQILFSMYYQGVIYQRIGQYDQALKFMLRTRDIGNENGVNSYLGMTYNNLGIIYRNLGEYERALEFYKKALIVEKQYKQEVNLTPIYNNLGMIYFYLKEYDAALNELDYALEVLINYTTDYYSVESALTNTKALVLIEQGEYAAAKIILDKVQVKEIARYGKAWAGSGPTLQTLGKVYAKMGDFNASNNYYDQSIEITRNVLGPKTDKLSEMFNLKGQNYLRTKNYEAALQTFQQNLISLVIDFNKLGYKDNPNVTSLIFDKVELIEAQYLKSKALLAMYNDTKEVDYLFAAETSNKTATELVDLVRKNMLYESSKMNLSNRAKTIYEQTIDIALLLEKETGRVASTIVFEAMENSKAYILSESIQKAKALGYTNLPESIINKEDSFRTKIKVLKSRQANILLHSKDSIELSKVGEQLFTTKESLEEYKQTYAVNSQVYKHIVPEASSFQANLATDELLIEYFAGESSLYAIAIDRTKVKIYELGDYRESINEFIQSLKQVQQATVNDYQSQAQDVYNIILAPILADYKQPKRLVIIPDRQLGFIPFDALVTNVVDNPRYNSLAYLIKKYTLMQHQTVGLYLGQQHQHALASELFIGFAPDFDENELLVVSNNQLRISLLL